MNDPQLAKRPLFKTELRDDCGEVFQSGGSTPDQILADFYRPIDATATQPAAEDSLVRFEEGVVRKMNNKQHNEILCAIFLTGAAVSDNPTYQVLLSVIAVFNLLLAFLYGRRERSVEEK